jgi:penicillin-binding protein 1A
VANNNTQHHSFLEFLYTTWQLFYYIIYQTISYTFYYTPFNWKTFKKMSWWAILLSIFVMFLVGFFILIFCIYLNVFGLFGALPDIERTEKKIPASSEIYTADGVLLGKYFHENRSPVRYHEISVAVINALIATEDIRFYNHKGIDFSALGSAFFSNILLGDRRGASTITQQLVKNLFKTRKTNEGLAEYIPFLRTYIYKLKEWITAVRLEFNYNKKEILTMYLNTVDFGNSAYGIRTASKTYFNKKPSQLNHAESAMLVGLLKATSTYNPMLHPEKCRERRNTVLGQLRKYKYITELEYKYFIKRPLGLNVKPEKVTEKFAPHFKNSAIKFLTEWCSKNNYDLYTDGLKIYTTIDSRLQKHAEDAIAKKMQQLQQRLQAHWAGRMSWQASNETPEQAEQYIINQIKKQPPYDSLIKLGKDSLALQKMREKRKVKLFSWEGTADSLVSAIDSAKHYIQILQAGLLTLDPRTGFIKSWVGGINYDFFSYDHVFQARRQPGSTFKPFVYTEALEKGMSPCDKLLDQPVTIEYEENGERKAWTPNNSNHEYAYDNITLRKGMATSKNTITARLTEKYGWDAIQKRAKDMGISSPIKAVPSIGLGSSEVSIIEMVGAYSSFMNQGTWTEPQYIAEIKNRQGETIYKATPKTRRVMSEETAFLMTEMFKATVQEQGATSQALWEFDLFGEDNDIGGKTGTSSNYADGWYIGITKDLVTGVWVGADDHRVRFRTPELGEASQTALPVYGIFMENVYKDAKLPYKKGKYPAPKTKINKDYNCPTPYYFAPKKEKNTE